MSNHGNKYFSHVSIAVSALVVMQLATDFRVCAQAPSGDLSFEVATVKPVLVDSSHRFTPKHYWAHITPAGASYWSMTLTQLVYYAYGLDPNQVIGLEWMTVDRFDIEARFPEGTNKEDDRRMLQALLKDRFKLEFHLDRRELVADALVVGRRGANLSPSIPDSVDTEHGTTTTTVNETSSEQGGRSEITRNPDGSTTVKRVGKGTETMKVDQERSLLHFELSKITMGELAAKLGICLGTGFHKVVDETGIKGSYHLAYDCPQPRPQFSAGNGAAASVPFEPEDGSLLTRSLDTIGLKLEKRKVPTEVYVIDHALRPSDN